MRPEGEGEVDKVTAIVLAVHMFPFCASVEGRVRWVRMM